MRVGVAQRFLCWFHLGNLVRRFIVVPAAQLDRVQPQFMRGVIHHPFDPDHALRAAEPAIGGGGLGVGLQPVALDPRIGQQIGVVRMQHRAVGDGQGQVLRPAADGVVQERDTLNMAVLIKSGLVRCGKRGVCR